MNTVNLALKAEIIKCFGTQVEADQHMGIRENRLSYIVRGHVEPTEEEQKAFEKALGRRLARRLLRGDDNLPQGEQE